MSDETRYFQFCRTMGHGTFSTQVHKTDSAQSHTTKTSRRQPTKNIPPWRPLFAHYSQQYCYYQEFRAYGSMQFPSTFLNKKKPWVCDVATNFKEQLKYKNSWPIDRIWIDIDHNVARLPSCSLSGTEPWLPLSVEGRIVWLEQSPRRYEHERATFSSDFLSAARLQRDCLGCSVAQ